MRLEHVLKALRVVVGSAVERFAKGEEGHGARLRQGANEFDQFLHGDAAPLGDAAPTLDAMVHGDLIRFAQIAQVGKRKFNRILDESTNLELEIAEAAFGHVLPVVAYGQLAIRPHVRRDVTLRIRLLRHEPIEGEQLHGKGNEFEHMLQGPRLMP